MTPCSLKGGDCTGPFLMGNSDSGVGVTPVWVETLCMTIVRHFA